MFDAALPFWGTPASIVTRGGFYEELDSRRPSDRVPFKRTRAMCRQVYVFSHAAMLGWTEGTPTRRARATTTWSATPGSAAIEAGRGGSPPTAGCSTRRPISTISRSCCSRWPGVTGLAAIATPFGARTRRSTSSSTGCGPTAARASCTSGRRVCRGCRIRTCTCSRPVARGLRRDAGNHGFSTCATRARAVCSAPGSSTAARSPSTSPRTGSGAPGDPKAASSSRVISSSGPGSSQAISASRGRTSYRRPTRWSRLPKRHGVDPQTQVTSIDVRDDGTADRSRIADLAEHRTHQGPPRALRARRIGARTDAVAGSARLLLDRYLDVEPRGVLDGSLRRCGPAGRAPPCRRPRSTTCSWRSRKCCVSNRSSRRRRRSRCPDAPAPFALRRRSRNRAIAPRKSVLAPASIRSGCS